MTCALSEQGKRQHHITKFFKNRDHSYTRCSVSTSGGCILEALLALSTVERSEHMAPPAQRTEGETTVAEYPRYCYNPQHRLPLRPSRHFQAGGRRLPQASVGTHVALISPPLLQSHRIQDASELGTELGAVLSSQYRASGGAPVAGRPAT